MKAKFKIKKNKIQNKERVKSIGIQNRILNKVKYSVT